jgi:hypothetical protein
VWVLAYFSRLGGGGGSGHSSFSSSSFISLLAAPCSLRSSLFSFFLVFILLAAKIYVFGLHKLCAFFFFGFR